MGLVLLPVALIAYFVGIFLFMVQTLRRTPGGRSGAMAALVVAWVLHLGAIVHHAMQVGRFPLGNLHEYLLVLGWVVLTLHLLVWLRTRVDAAGLILPPLAALMALGALLIPARSTRLPEGQEQAWFIFHTGLATVGMAALCVAFAMSVIYLIQDRSLKSKKRLRLLDRLPSIEACDRIGYHAVLWGFPLLTLGIATGLVWSYHEHHTVFTQGAKELFSYLAWAVFALLLYARLARGFRGRKSAYLTIAGFAFGLLVVLGMTR